MTSTIKVNNIQNQCGTNIINESSNTITIGASGDTIALASGASQTGFGRTGTVDWDTTAKTASFTAENGKGYFVNTSSSAVTVTLPASPSAGDIVAVADYTRTWSTNNCTIGRNSEPIGGLAFDATLETDGQSATFVYVDGTEGWININETSTSVTGDNPNLIATGGTITTCGNFKIHTFTGPGTFEVTNVSTTAANNIVSYLVAAGGGGGGATNSGSFAAGGGGAGGFREYKGPADCYTASPLNGNPGGTAITVTEQAYPITVGAGGAAGPTSSGTIKGSSGADSVFSVITSAGGGGGGAGANPASPGAAGGSGGGAGGFSPGSGTGGAGNTPPVSPPQGNTGGASGPNTGPGASGGGATGAGVDATTGSGNPRTGGTGAASSITGSPVTRSVGGASGNYPGNPGSNGGDNTGTGGQGGGGNAASSGIGGSGIVIIRYKFQ